MASVEDIAAGVKAILDAGTFDYSVTCDIAARVPVFEADALTADPKVNVIPYGLAVRKAGRNMVQRDLQANILVTCRLTDAVTRSGLNNFVEDLQTELAKVENKKVSGATWTETEVVALYDYKIVDETDIYQSLFRVTYTELVTRGS